MTELQQDTATREKYMEWLTTPLADREIKSERQLAIHLGTSRSNLNRWKNDWRFAAEVANRLSRHLDIGEIPDVMATMLTVAKDPDNPRNVQAARTILDYVKWNLERAEEINIDVRSLSDDELADLLVDALNVLDSRK